MVIPPRIMFGPFECPVDGFDILVKFCFFHIDYVKLTAVESQLIDGDDSCGHFAIG
jgi:hypothetical protein